MPDGPEPIPVEIHRARRLLDKPKDPDRDSGGGSG